MSGVLCGVEPEQCVALEHHRFWRRHSDGRTLEKTRITVEPLQRESTD
jgi:hypothetical protein